MSGESELAWSTEDHILLIKLWSRMPEWIVQKNDRESVRKRRGSLKAIAKKLQRSETETKIKMTLLRTIYSNETRKYSDSVSSGNEVYKIIWPYYKSLSFLSNVHDQPNGDSPLNGESKCDPLSHVKIEHEEVDVSDDELGVDYQHDDASNEGSTVTPPRPSLSTMDAYQAKTDVWTTKQIFELIDFWRDSPIFYDKNVKAKGAVKVKRATLLRDFANKINKDADEVKYKMKNLQANFRQEVKKYRNSLQSGNPDEVRYIKWQYFVPLAFLAPEYDYDMSTHDHMGSDTDASMSNQSTSNQTHQQSIINEVSYKTDHQRLVRRHNETNKTRDLHNSFVSIPKCNMSLLTEEGNGSCVTEANSECAESTPKRFRLEDETDMFCSHIAAELKQLPANVRRTVKFRIQQIVFEAQVQADQASAIPS